MHMGVWGEQKATTCKKKRGIAGEITIEPVRKVEGSGAEGKKKGQRRGGGRTWGRWKGGIAKNEGGRYNSLTKEK